MTKKEQKAAEARVTKAYGRSCQNVQISIWDMSKIMAYGLELVRQKDEPISDAGLETKIRRFVDALPGTIQPGS